MVSSVSETARNKQSVDDPRVVPGHRRKLLRPCEYHMAVGNRQQIGRLRRQPFIPSRGLALGVMPVPARVLSEDLPGASIALLDMSAEGGGAACADVTECSKLVGRENMTPPFEEFLFVLTKDIGFQPPFSHL